MAFNLKKYLGGKDYAEFRRTASSPTIMSFPSGKWSVQVGRTDLEVEPPYKMQYNARRNQEEKVYQLVAFPRGITKVRLRVGSDDEKIMAYLFSPQSGNHPSNESKDPVATDGILWSLYDPMAEVEKAGEDMDAIVEAAELLRKKAGKRESPSKGGIEFVKSICLAREISYESFSAAYTHIQAQIRSDPHGMLELLKASDVTTLAIIDKYKQAGVLLQDKFNLRVVLNPTTGADKVGEPHNMATVRGWLNEENMDEESVRMRSILQERYKAVMQSRGESDEEEGESQL